MQPTAQQIIELLHLAKHSTCGYVKQTYRSPHRIQAQALPPGYQGERSLGSVLYFLVTPDAEIVLHRIQADQMYHHYGGDPLEVLLLYLHGSGEVRTLGFDLQKGIHPQLFIPGGTYHMSRVAQGGRYALLGTSEWPVVEPVDVEVGNPDQLVAAYPVFADAIRSFSRLPGRDGS